MFKIFMSVVVLKLLLICSLAVADSGYVKGEIEYVRVHDPINSSWAAPRFWFTLKGVGSAGNCKVWSHSNTVLFVGETSEMYSAILANYMAGKEVAVRFDSSHNMDGYCKVYFLTLGEPPILH